MTLFSGVTISATFAVRTTQRTRSPAARAALFQRLSERIAGLGRPNAAKDIVNEIEKLIA